MISVETNTRKRKGPNHKRALEICFHFVDGSTEFFVQPDPEIADGIRRQIQPAQLFSRPRIVIADDYSKSVFVPAQISRIDFAFTGEGFSHIPDDHADMVELTEGEFREHVPHDSTARLQKRTQRRQVGDLLVSFLDLRMNGGSHVYLMNEILVKLPAESQSYMQRLLSKSAFAFRLACGGHAFLNLANLIGYTVYPGVAEVPSDTWMAQPKRDNE